MSSPSSSPLPSRITFAMVRDELRANGVTIAKRDSEFLVRLKGSPIGAGYYTSDLTDALDTGMAMAAENKGVSYV